MAVEFEDFTIRVTEALEETALQWLYESSELLVDEVANNSRVKSGQLRGSWKAKVNENAFEAKVGSPEQNALWEEFGTGEHSVNGDGRKGGWRYQDEDGNWHFTRGKKPNRALQKAYNSNKGKIINRAKQIFREGMS